MFNHSEAWLLLKGRGVCLFAGVCLFVHIRQQHTVGMEDLHEILANAATTGASVHICHTLATGRYAGQSGWADMLQMVTGINAHGVDVSMEQYPYPYVSPQLTHVLVGSLWPRLTSFVA